METLLGESQADRARLEELRAEASAFLVSHPPGPLEAHIEQTVGKRKMQRRWWGGALMAPVLTGLVALTFLVLRPEEHSPDERDWELKGNGVTLRVHRQVKAGSVQVKGTDELAPGDILRFEVRSGTPGFLAVVGQDSRGRVSVYHPKAAPDAVPIAKGWTRIPPFPLSDAPGKEEVSAIFSRTPFELAPVVRALEEGRPMSDILPSGAEVTSLSLRKQREPRLHGP
ncbi:DUF4384 domain-containing protein [Archangium gephyra]|uniref:DUF4384 domain-containing protein n=1 Tax=Archangium gephyra TaxID=48 RepID=UPI0014721A96|nr:DUF4384 domain-containing protein [Archangium gephyra]